MPEFTLPPLPYDYAALEPTIDTLTMQIHHDKHHAAYVNNLNAALKDQPDLQSQTVEALISDLGALPESIRTAVRNNGGGHANHTLFWEFMTPGGATAPHGALAAAVSAAFGDLESLKKQVNEAGAKRFGSGWAWVVTDGRGELSVISTANQDNPLMEGKKAVLGVDVWEHAYYLKYQNRRPDYLAAWWNVVNWDVVGRRYDTLRG
ncbi:MAG: superoxide dismutase [Armatimonadetes bacterium]|nr:superoxide dismutase [Armatimonadota bacterium]MDE2206048.1 superoxide dismutase [Armatimonadota bacterium]